jgi:hypothetical protein
MRHKNDPPYHLLKAEQISLNHALLRFGGEITGLVVFDDFNAIVAEITFPDGTCYVGDIAKVLSTLSESATASVAEKNFAMIRTFSKPDSC